MLTNMFIGDPPGNHDRILDFSTAVTGNLFFVPSADFLDDPSTTPPAIEAPAGPRRLAWDRRAQGLSALRQSMRVMAGSS